MKILLAHLFYAEGLDRWYQEMADAAPAGLEVTPFPVTLDPPGPRLARWELEQRWKARDPSLMRMYDRLKEAATDHDVLLHFNGANIHEGLLPYLPTYNVYCCFDDPESSSDLSEPMARHFDAVFYGNIASRPQYEAWGCERLAWIPNFIASSEVPAASEEADLFGRQRDVDISMVGELTGFRRARLEALVEAFPDARCHGSGWPAGRISYRDMWDMFRRTRIGWNVHNSTGPINQRLYYLAAYGIFQLCDNKTGLGQIFELGREAVGFDTIPEAVELTRYYLDHDEERAEIAHNGYRRFWRDYHPTVLWSRIAGQIETWMGEREDRHPGPRRKLPARTPISLARPLVDKVKHKTTRLLGESAGMLRDLIVRGEQDESLDERVYTEQDAPAPLDGLLPHPWIVGSGDLHDEPRVQALDWAATVLLRDAKTLVELGSRTGGFAWLAGVDAARTVHACELEPVALEWARQHRGRDNIHYLNDPDEAERSEFDLVVSLGGLERADDLGAFLVRCAALAPRAILGTVNRTDDGSNASRGYLFSPGEMQLLLGQHYATVRLYTLPDPHVPWLEPLGPTDQAQPILAECQHPR